jgi:hypothetical protein
MRRLVAALLAALVVVPAFPAGASPRNPGLFVDDDGHPQEQAFEYLAMTGVVKGCNPPRNDRICPHHPLTRAEMAKMIVLIGQQQGTIGPLPAGRADRFGDDDEVWNGSAEPLIDLIAAEGIVHGCNPPANDRFCPLDGLTRAQTAKLVVNGLELTAPPSYLSPWTDTAGTWYHEVARVAAYHGLFDSSAGVFAGQEAVRRSDLAEVLVRAVGEDRCREDPFTAARGAGLAADYPGKKFTAYVYDEVSGCAYWLNPDHRQETASVFKVMVMAGTLLEAQLAGRPPSGWEWSQLEPMITESANEPVRALWNHFGGYPWFTEQAAIFGLSATTVSGDQQEAPWGRTLTSARDQADLLRQVLLGEWGPLEATGRSHAWELMTSVISSQRWGVTAGVPEGWVVAQKNGFAGDTTNSVGVVRGPGGEHYVVVILTSGWPSWEQGVPAVERVSVWVASTFTE